MHATALLLMMSLTAAVSAQQSAPRDPPPRRDGPPQEAFDACKGKKEGDAAQTKLPHSESMSGLCRMVLVPSRPAQAPQPAPPPPPPPK